MGRVTLEHAAGQYDCYFVDDGYEEGQEICGAKIVGHIGDLDKLFTEYKNLVVSIGNNPLRERIYKMAEKIGYSFPNIVCNSVYISPFAEVGDGCIFLNNACIQNGSSVGKGVILNPGVEIHHDSIVKDYALIYTNSVVRTMACIGKRAKIGSNCTISNNKQIAEDSVMEDGTVEC